MTIKKDFKSVKSMTHSELIDNLICLFLTQLNLFHLKIIIKKS